MARGVYLCVHSLTQHHPPPVFLNDALADPTIIGVDKYYIVGPKYWVYRFAQLDIFP